MMMIVEQQFFLSTTKSCHSHRMLSIVSGCIAFWSTEATVVEGTCGIFYLSNNWISLCILGLMFTIAVVDFPPKDSLVVRQWHPIVHTFHGGMKKTPSNYSTNFLNTEGKVWDLFVWGELLILQYAANPPKWISVMCFWNFYSLKAFNLHQI